MIQPVSRLFSDGRFEGRSTIITGAASGIGFALAKALVTRGACVAMADVRKEAVEEAAHSVDPSGRQVTPIPLDVRSRDKVEAAADVSHQRFGPPHLVVNNAGVARLGGSLEDVDEATSHWLIDVNVHGVLNGIGVFGPRIRANGLGGGHILNTASLGGLFMAPGWHVGLYAGSKMAVVALSLDLRMTMARANIGVSVICPGRTEGDIRQNSVSLAPSDGPQVTNLPADVDDNVMPARLSAQIILHGVVADRAIILTHPEEKPDIAQFHRVIMDEFDFWQEAKNNLPLS